MNSNQTRDTSREDRDRGSPDPRQQDFFQGEAHVTNAEEAERRAAEAARRQRGLSQRLNDVD